MDKERYVKGKKKTKNEHTYGSLRPRELCNKSLIMSFSVKDSSMENVLFMCWFIALGGVHTLQTDTLLAFSVMCSDLDPLKTPLLLLQMSVHY